MTDLEHALLVADDAILLVHAYEVECARRSDELAELREGLARARALADAAEALVAQRVAEHGREVAA